MHWLIECDHPYMSYLYTDDWDEYNVYWCDYCESEVWVELAY